MKKLSVLLGLFLISTHALGGDFHDIIVRNNGSDANEYLVADQTNKRVKIECDDDQGDAQQVVAYRVFDDDLDPVFGNYGDGKIVVGAWKCRVEDDGDLWGNLLQVEQCENNICKTNIRMAVPLNEKFDICAPHSAEIRQVRHVILTSGLEVGCLIDKTQEQKDNQERIQKCTSSGGSWSNGACTCASAKKLKLNAGGTACECINSDYEYKSASGACEETDAAKQRRQRQQQQQQQTNAKAKCEKSGGTYKSNKCSCDNAQNLREQNGECVCLDNNYKRNGNKCDLTDAAAARQDCEAASDTGAYWDGDSCECENPQHVFRNKKCVLNPDIANCEKINGAAWNQIKKECVCKDNDKEINAEGTECVETDEARQRREDSAAASLLITSRRQIDSAISELDGIRSGFKVSVWKDEEGKFNTARLVSDSVAGVVLGTAGGLITSNVVKKNQVENGFEDIQCTVGGQKVADWGDEFRVGIQ